MEYYFAYKLDICIKEQKNCFFFSGFHRSIKNKYCLLSVIKLEDIYINVMRIWNRLI